mgnify:CR=1 FL=1|tara:strand:- start:72807 stop:73091 length:285 start_codon:yes stop_codon:yes gene_type:complete
MSRTKEVFRNYDIKRIKMLLKEIGQERYNAALEDVGLKDSKPLGMKGFFVEYEVNTKDVNLYHRYPSGVEMFIMPVLGYWAIPHKDWELIRKKV